MLDQYRELVGALLDAAARELASHRPSAAGLTREGLTREGLTREGARC